MLDNTHLMHGLDNYVSEARRVELYQLARNTPGNAAWAINQAIYEAIYAAEHGVTIDRQGRVVPRAVSRGT